MKAAGAAVRRPRRMLHCILHSRSTGRAFATGRRLLPAPDSAPPGWQHCSGGNPGFNPGRVAGRLLTPRSDGGALSVPMDAALLLVGRVRELDELDRSLAAMSETPSGCLVEGVSRESADPVVDTDGTATRDKPSEVLAFRVPGAGGVDPAQLTMARGLG